ncbi:serine-rich adhesin for platelets [Drosophila virilis]|uniref:Uncharacterized protein n=1 Tax=Drosophila virilis TaxID=7244 RepID=B4M981_DROVI|nr:uncharacterized protein LOC6634331 [Drosophila virilis]EDW57757.1 uncharacterized protein Dvir_GJ17968 [Drosophila virilis]
MQSMKGTLLLLTLCLGAGGIWAKPSSAIFEDVWGDLKDGGNSIIEGLREATNDGAAIGKNLLDNLKSTNDKFLDDVGQLGEDLSNAISEALSTGLKDLSQDLVGNITAFKGEIDAEKNLIKRGALKNGIAALEELSSVVDELKSGVFNISQKLGEKVHIQLNETYNDLLSWGDEQLDRVDKGTDGVGVPQASQLITQLVDRHVQNLISIVEELEVKKSLLEQKLNDKISEYAGYAKDLIDAMNSCRGLSIIRCRSRIEEAIENLSDARNELKILLKKGNTLLEAGVFASDSIVALINQLAKDKRKLEKDLDGIIKDNPTSTTTSTSPTASDDASSTESDDASDASSFFGDILSKLGDGSRSLFESIFNATKNGAALGKDILDGLDNKKAAFLADITQLGKDLSSAISNSLITGLADLTTNLQGNITDLEGKIKDEKNLIKKKALNNGLAALKQLNSTAFQLQSALSNLNSKLAEELNDQVQEAIDDLLEWKKQQLERVNNATDGAGLPLATGLIKLLIQRHTQNLFSTLRNFELLKSQFEKQVNDRINEYTRYARELIAKMNQCLIGPISALRCQANTAGLAAKLNNAKNELQKLIRQSQKLIKAGVYASKNIASLLKQLAKDKLKCEKDLDGIIEDNPSENATEASTTPDADDTTIPAEDTTDSTASSTQSGEDNTDAAEDTAQPTADTTDPAADPSQSADDTTDAADSSTDAADSSTDAADSSTDAADSSTDAADSSTDAADDTTQPADDSTDPADDTTDPAQDTTQPADDSTDPSDESTDPTDSST